METFSVLHRFLGDVVLTVRCDSSWSSNLGTQPSLDGAAFYFVLPTPRPFLGVAAFPHRSFWVALVFSSLLLGCVAFSPLGGVWPSLSSFWCGTASLLLPLCLSPS